MKTHPKGFSLIELLIVVAIILIIAAIAIPNLLQSRIAANQASAVESCRAINDAQIKYASTYNTGYSTDLVSLGGTATPPTASAAGLIAPVLSEGAKSGYNFTYTAGAPDESGKINTYTLTAEPISVGTTGTNRYFTDQSGVIRQNSTGPATASSPPLDE
jgi:prepilin-type N-terminal cleavage/methylation domain-containing protein